MSTRPIPDFERLGNCRHLDTINRKNLDFEREKLCLVCCKHSDVYACLVCGKYFHGKSRSLQSHAFIHSVKSRHYVYVNMKTAKFYCLIDGCQVNHSSLDDIRQALNPRFSRDRVLQLDRNVQWLKALNGSHYLPGMVGLRNMEADFVNVTIQSLMRVTPLRNFFLFPENYVHTKSEVVQRFGELTRKIWHAPNFKGQVSPFEFSKAVRREFGKSDPVEFTSWLLKTLHNGLQNPNRRSNIICDCFKGEVQFAGNTDGRSRKGFLMLGLDLPALPVSMDSNIIPEVPLFDILKDCPRVTKLPRYLILHMRRFTKNSLSSVQEKNPTLVNFPLKNLELKDYIIPSRLCVPSKYELIANIVHDGKPSSYTVFVQQKSEQLWYQIRDLHVVRTPSQTVASSEAYMLIYEWQ
ncbi:hypothetical protein OSB04_007923 [Centaurea solstitialis]|uniref:Ubiquitinyl hydrolase 1 n=1 Tax=Centaurea solstitialis TaxID=347529 RepID=A0AA38U5A7_9ASTR|nr:hypothetical protein OSB04_007923 [Centaurea solstitialis]